jgi:hypothetical protein
MGKSRRGVGLLLALVLVLPAPALTACFGSDAGAQAAKQSERIAAQRAQDIAAQRVRDFTERAGPGAGVGGVGAGWCAASENCRR